MCCECLCLEACLLEFTCMDAAVLKFTVGYAGFPLSCTAKPHTLLSLLLTSDMKEHSTPCRSTVGKRSAGCSRMQLRGYLLWRVKDHQPLNSALVLDLKL